MKKKFWGYVLILLGACIIAIVFHCIFPNSVVKNAIPIENYTGKMNADYEVINQDVFFVDDATGNLMVTNMKTIFKVAKDLGVKNIGSMKKGGKYLYLFSEEQNITVYDTEIRKCVAEVNLRDKIDGMKKNGRVMYSMLQANEEGAFVVMDNDEQNWIILITSEGETKIIKKIDDMLGDIRQLTVTEKFIIFPYNSSDEDIRGTYCLNRDTGELVRKYDKIAASTTDICQPFIWEKYYGFVQYSMLYLISIEGNEVIEVDLKYSCKSTFVDGDYLYRGQWKGIERYNLRTREVEVANRDKMYCGDIKIIDDIIYLGYCKSTLTHSSSTNIYYEDLRDYKWEPSD